MIKVYGAKSEFTTVDQDRSFRKAVFGLAWFHTLVIERKKFRTLGWNVKYTFNESDYSVCEDLIANYLGRTEEGKVIDETYDKKQPIPWEAIQYLIAQCNYGGRVTDDRDRKLIDVYSKEIFNDNLIAPEKWRPYGTEELKYHYPADEQNTKVDPIALFNPDFF
jgi:dynein heavy chain